MKPTIQPIKGTRDYYPAEMAVRNFLYQTVRKVSESFGYQEWDGPFLESIELYAAKSGEELVNQQSFVFPDRGGDLITLRPELTPSLARMVAQRQKQLVYPLRWWTWGPCWRYERPQKGRTREFFQWNIDLIGVDTPEADAEMAAIAASFLREAGLSADQVSLKVNNRKLINEELLALGVPAEKCLDVLRLIDRRDKMSQHDWQDYAKDLSLDKTQVKGVEAMLADFELWRKSKEMVRFFDVIDSLGVRSYVRYAPNVIRGLDYYTGTVFEAWDRAGEFRAILGGGRYDNLVSDVGGEPLAATGFAMGDLGVSLVLKKFGCLPPGIDDSPAQVLVTVFDQESLPASFALATELRQAGIDTTCFVEPAKLARQIKYADRMGMRLVLILGPDERAKGQVTLKNLASGEQRTVAQAEIVNIIWQVLERGSSS